MALNIKPFEGPKAPDWTDPAMGVEVMVKAKTKTPSGEDPLNNSDGHRLFAENAQEKDIRDKLKKLDIL